MYCVERGEKYINFPPVPVLEYFQKERVRGEYYDVEASTYKTIEVIPELSDLDYLRTFKFEALTFRGTVEFRSVCCQPIKDSMVVAAFHLGLKENLPELRKMFDKAKLSSFVDENLLYQLAQKVVVRQN